MRLLKKIQSAARRRANFFVGRHSNAAEDQSSVVNLKNTVTKKKKQSDFSF
ncbi:MAG: hypothetical protein H2061_05545 [Burkholderiales bacterium]|nr:hypothetical protein [Burkholderiales bacterium]|tara:strand:+ start:383 stop:535 length:153 start_codon:yes stop_codon:yes gene_type:complete